MLLKWVLAFITVGLLDTHTDGAITIDRLDEMITQMESKVDEMMRHLMIQQTIVEEQSRSDGNSGIKQTRVTNSGTRPYYSQSYMGGSALSIHDHSNYDRTLGMGEFAAILNGVDFRTRHNDYKLYKAHTTQNRYHYTEPIAFPEVPPQVLSQKTTNDQIKEMREWFKAWRDQDYSKRDYRNYFQPVLCYLEGTWTGSTGKSLEEAFKSDRHFIDANSWFDLQNKIRFAAYNGRKSLLENYTYLPTTIQQILNGTNPVFAQWNYRLLCSPVGEDIPFNRLRLVDDFANRMAYKATYEKQRGRRSARFQLNPKNSNKWEDGFTEYTWLDKIMAKIPGKDNYLGKIYQDDISGLPTFEYGSKTKRLNSAFYHRIYTVKEGANYETRRRTYSDSNVFMARTTQEKVSGMKTKSCSGPGNSACKDVVEKWSYAVPIELVYLTPLHSWNPFNILLKKWNDKTVNAKGRNGGFTKTKAYDGGKANGYYYTTPSAFFTGGEIGKDPADTSRGSVGVLDQSGNVRSVRASGIRITTPKIPDVGAMRTRYPLFPVYVDGNPVWKEMEALKDMIMEQSKYVELFRQPPLSSAGSTGTAKAVSIFVMQTSTKVAARHVHRITLSADEMTQLKAGKQFVKSTTQDQGHTHQIKVAYVNKRFMWTICDNKPSCWDGHGKYLTVTEN